MKRATSKRTALKAPPRKQPGLVRFFLRGIVTLAPVVLTLVVFGLLFQMVNTYVTGPINRVIYWTLEGTGPGWRALGWMSIDPYEKKYLDPSLLTIDLQDVARVQPEGYSSPEFLNALRLHRHEHASFFRSLDELAINDERLRRDVQGVVHPLIGLVLSLLLVLWLGWLVGSFVGRSIVARLDRTLHLIPVIKSIYPYSKQLVEFFFAEKKIEFDTVVAAPYPSPGVWSMGFVTSKGLRTLREETGKRLVGIFIPSSPMPMTGYTIFLEIDRVVPLPLTVDQALRIVMSGGVLVPPEQRVDGSDDPEIVAPPIPGLELEAFESDVAPPAEDADDESPPPAKQEPA